jgi:hypothetical protein
MDILDGPAWLEEQADRLSGQSMNLEADQFRQLAKAWNAERAEHQQLQDEASSLQIRLTNTRAALEGGLRAH